MTARPDVHPSAPLRVRADVELFFITGGDALNAIPGWRAADELFELAPFVGVTRPGYPLGDARRGSRRAR